MHNPKETPKEEIKEVMADNVTADSEPASIDSAEPTDKGGTSDDVRPPKP